MSILQRIQYLVDERCDGNRSRFARDTGIGVSAVSAMYRRTSGGISSDTVALILTAYKDLNARWLLCGEGKPWHTPDKVYDNHDFQDLLTQILSQQLDMGQLLHELMQQNRSLFKDYLSMKESTNTTR